MDKDSITFDIEKLTDKQLKQAYDHVHSDIFINYQRIKSEQEYYFEGIHARVKATCAIVAANNNIKRCQHKLIVLECEIIRREVFHE